MEPRARSPASVADIDLKCRRAGSDGAFAPRALTSSLTRSGSPRPRPWRPLDAVALARKELTQAEGAGQGRRKVRLASLTATGAGGTVGGPGDDDAPPALHEGFYSLASPVIRPQMSAREIAARFQEQFAETLQFAKRDGEGMQAKAEGDAAAADHPAASAPDTRARDALSARREAEICVSTLIQYICSTSTDCRERGAFLNAVNAASTAAIRRLQEAVSACVSELWTSKERHGTLEQERSDLVRENHDRMRVQQMLLGSEGELRKDFKQLQQHAAQQERELQQFQDILREREEVLRASEERCFGLKNELRLLQKHARQNMDTRDASCSPINSLAEESFLRRRPAADTHPSDRSIVGVFHASEVPDNEGEGWSSEDPMSTTHSPPLERDAAGFLRAHHLRRPSDARLAQLKACHEKEAASHKATQEAVDAVVKRIAHWVHAVHESLQDLSNAIVHPEMWALDVFRDAMQWLGKHGCKSWSSPASSLTQILDDHEGRFHRILTSDRFADAQFEEMRHVLVQQERRISELSSQLQSAASPASSRLIRRASSALRDSPRELQSQSTPRHMREQRPASTSTSVAVQCQLLHTPVGEPARLAVPDGAVAPEAECTEPGRGELVESLAFSGASMPDAEGYASVDAVGTRNDGADTRASQPQDVPPEDDDGTSQTVLAPASLGAAAVAAVDAEGMKQRLLTSNFVEAIDLTAVSCDEQILVSLPHSGAGSQTFVKKVSTANDGVRESADDRLLGLGKLQAFIADVYVAKRADDLRRDKLLHPRRPLTAVVQEHLRQQHGVKCVVHQKSWQLVESLIYHAAGDLGVWMFSEFLDGTRDVHELSFYLYCCGLSVAAVPEHRQEARPVPASTRTPAGFTNLVRAQRLGELIFGDLPKTLGVVKVELEKHARTLSALMPNLPHDWASADARGPNDGLAVPAQLVPTERVYHVLLEGWRMSALLLDSSVVGFSWRASVLAFMQADLAQRGWLDPHDVKAAEAQLVSPDGASGRESFRALDCTSLGAFVFRFVHRVQNDETCTTALALSAKPAAAPPAGESFMQVVTLAFRNIEPCLEVYLKSLMHSDELRDLATFSSLRCRLYTFRRSTSDREAGAAVHSFRSLLLLLLAHQFDSQLLHGMASAEYLQWELQCLFCVLRESWRRNAGDGVGPEFGPALDSVGEAQNPP